MSKLRRTVGTRQVQLARRAIEHKLLRGGRRVAGLERDLVALGTGATLGAGIYARVGWGVLDDAGAARGWYSPLVRVCSCNKYTKIASMS